MSENRVPLRLLVHFQRSALPLVQVTDCRVAADGSLRGAGSRGIDLSNPARTVRLRDPLTGGPLDEHVTIEHALAVLAALSYPEGA